MDNVRFIAVALGCETEWLLTGKTSATIRSANAIEANENKATYSLFPASIQTVIEIMKDLDSVHREKVVFAAKLAKEEFCRMLEQNSIKRVGE